MHQSEGKPNEVQSDNRRKFLKTAGKFAAATPPAIAILMSTTLEADAIGKSGGGHHKGRVHFKRRMRKEFGKKKKHWNFRK